MQTARPGAAAMPSRAVVGVCISLCVAVILAALPMSSTGLIVALVTCPALLHRGTRLFWVVFAGLVTLAHSDDLGFGKIVYLIGIAIVIAIASIRFRELREGLSYQLVRPMLMASTLFPALAVVSLIVSVENHALMTDWLRDAAPYLLLGLVGLVALDAESGLTTETSIGALVVGGVLTGLAFSVQYASRRQILYVPIAVLIGPSALLPSALFSYLSANALIGRRWRLPSALLAAAVLGVLLVTGTRSVLVLLLSPIAIALLGGRNGAPVIRLAGYGSLGILATLVTASVLLPTLGVDQESLQSRYGKLLDLAGLSSDYSYLERANEVGQAWQAFLSSPLLGVGPGHIFIWSTASGTSSASFNMDTSVSLLAKFGMLGAVVLLAFLAGMGRLMQRYQEDTDGGVAGLALTSFALVALGWLVLGAPLEDKGFSYGLMLLMAIRLRVYSEGRVNAVNQHPPAEG